MHKELLIADRSSSGAWAESLDDPVLEFLGGQLKTAKSSTPVKKS